MILIKKFVFNPLQVNTYVLYDETREAVIIDAACFSDNERNELDLFIEENGLKPVKLLSTHCHFDHIWGNEHVRDKYDIKLAIHSEDAFLIENAAAHGEVFGLTIEPLKAADEFVGDGDRIAFGNSVVEVLHLPGHSPGGLGFYCEAQKFVIVGDVLFRGGIGRTDLPKGSFETLIDSIKNKLMPLGAEVKILPGHGPETTVEEEVRNNMFLK